MSKRNLFRNSLSKNLMQMKFMQKTKDKNERDLEEEDNRRLLDEEYNENMRKEGQKFVIDSSYLYCERLSFGRMSFKGMNPEIEKLMKELEAKSGDKNVKNNDSVDVSDEEMTNRYTKYVNSNAINRKRNRYSNKQNNRSDKRLKKVK